MAAIVMMKELQFTSEIIGLTEIDDSRKYDETRSRKVIWERAMHFGISAGITAVQDVFVYVKYVKQ